MREPEYVITIQRFDTEECLYHGFHRGKLVPLLEGLIMDHARTTDSGKRLSEPQLKKAYRHGRN